MYDLDEREVDGDESLKELLSTFLRSLIKKLIEEFINNLIIEFDIILKVKTLYNEDKTL